METTTKLKATIQDLPSPKDNNQWLAGGSFVNETLAGGYLFSPTNMPDPMSKPKQDEGYYFTNGDIHTFLNSGVSEMDSLVKGGEHFDLMQDTKQMQIYTVKMTIEIDGLETIISDIITDDGNGNVGSNLVQNTNTTMSIDTLQTMLDTKGINIFSPNLKGAFISWGIENVMNGNVFNSDKMTLKNFVSSSIIGSMKSIITNRTTQAVTQALGVKSVALAGVIGLTVSALFGEALEVALGLDNSFGYGGEVIGKDKFGNPVYQDKTLSKNLLNDIKSAFGMHTISSNTISNQKGDIIGSWKTDENGLLDSITTTTINGVTNITVSDKTFGWDKVKYTPDEVSEEIEKEIDEINNKSDENDTNDDKNGDGVLSSDEVDDDWNDDDFGYENNL